MKQVATVVLVTGLLGCNQQPKKESKLTNHSDKMVQIDSALTTKKAHYSKYHISMDTLFFATETGQTVKYEKDDFNYIVDNHPELFIENPDEPDQSFYCNSGNGEFGSEAGQDNYYILYAYLLKQKNGIDNNQKMRKKLIDIYANINTLFSRFQHGGTYFGHQYARIEGYAEYSVYIYLQSKDHIEKTYNITKQKEFYIKSLRQLIDDESKIDHATFGNDKIALSKELNKIVDNLNNLITDNFYLRRAQEFQYRHYQYY
ncbi:MAG: hypothetical protein H6607_10875 [Flavobacteriales bacterium]|nr:hypothetical protein [Flavobacteriales bacterium]